MSRFRYVALFGFLLATALGALAQGVPEPDYTPVRLSYQEGNVSFWRPGALDWLSARLNTALATGDGLSTGAAGVLELQIDSRAFIRADENTQLSLIGQSHDILRIKVAAGRVSFDLRELPSGYVVQVATPNALFDIRNRGYYRVEVGGETHFITRRGGFASVLPVGGPAQSILPSEQIVARDGGMIATYAAPPADQWDQWNKARSEELIDSLSSRYVPPGVAGIDDLDHYGTWRLVPEYGAIWLPDQSASDWAPYSTGAWVWDPNYEWTWVDDAPWGWAPYHYGRWVNVDGFWAWAPGPIQETQPAYAPALVAFFGLGHDAALRLRMDSAGVGWIALGWGEPVQPWWGSTDFRGKASWRGWAGPHRENATAARNGGTFIFAPDNGFSRNSGRPGYGRLYSGELQPQELAPLRGDLPISVPPASRIAPATKVNSSPVGAPRPDWITPPTPVVMPNRDGTVAPQPWNRLPRPQFGIQGGGERGRPPLAPQYGDQRHPAAPKPNTGESAPTRVAPALERTPAQAPRPAREVAAPVERRSLPDHTEQMAPHADAAPPRQEERHDRSARLPGRPANQTYHEPGPGR